MLVIEANAYDHEPRWWTTEREPLGGSSMGPCINQVIARWDSAQGSWIIQRYRERKTEGCSMGGRRT
jgi:hypothetical protein